MKKAFESIKRLLTVMQYGLQIFCACIFFSDSAQKIEEWAMFVAILVGFYVSRKVILWIISPIFQTKSEV